ncbi:MAG: DUF1446 domain-containing protein [Planctomycetes bacterium]|nr:DUF1446 domain-containing protein [Planctomycetota bacterium]
MRADVGHLGYRTTRHPNVTIRIGNGAGFLGDNLDAPRRLVESSELHYLTLEYLAELTLSILARSREKDPQAGYAQDFIEVLGSLLPALREQATLRIVTNAGGMNAPSCVRRASQLLVNAGLGDMPIGMVTGDDLLPRLESLRRAGCALAHLDTGKPLDSLHTDVVSANAYLGAREMVTALHRGARMVITGRVADASLTVAPAVHEFNWRWDDWHRLAGASVAGHLIECGAQATGGYHSRWNSLDLAHVGYPIAELNADATCTITKPDDSGGVVSRETICEQLVYEIGNPAHYLTPDVDVDFTGVEVAEMGANRVAVRGARGHIAPEMYKVSLTYRAGYMASGSLLVYGPDCRAKAQACADIIFARLEHAGWTYDRKNVELLGLGQGVPGLAPSSGAEPSELMLRIAVSDPRREAVERFTREFAPLATAGPAGLAGYTAARGTVRPVYAYWPTLVPRHLIETRCDVKTAQQWLDAEVGTEAHR